MTTIQKKDNSLNSKIKTEMLKLITLGAEAYETYLVDGCYLEAEQVAKTFNLKNDEKVTAAISAFGTCLTEGNNLRAAQIAKEFDIGKETQISAAMKAYDVCLVEGYYLDACTQMAQHIF